MKKMFDNATAFNQSLNLRDTSSVTDMTQIFNNASSFNGNISSWDISNITSMYALFYYSSFNQDISTDTSNVN